jgi:hypothetical protein
MKILEYRKIIGRHEKERRICSANFIKELSNGYFISGGTDSILIIYDSYGEIINGEMGKITSINDWTYSVTERMNYDKRSKNDIQFICCSNKQLFLFEADFIKKYIKYKKYDLPYSTCTKCVQMNNNAFALVGLDLSSFFPDLFMNHLDNYTIIEKTYRNAIKIDENILALTSNKVAVNGEDALIFFDSRKIKIDIRKHRIVHKIENYSFNFNTNGLALMYCDYKNKNRILLCACKKYFSDQRNGILLVKPQLIDNHDVHEPFYDTGDFEVYCFCPIFDFDYENKIYPKPKNSEFFFVGGFDNNKGEGLIKLYKLIYNERVCNVKIEYLQDIIIKKDINEGFVGFGGAVTCLIQSQYSGIILATCNDGNAYKFSIPNIDYYKE